MELQMNLAEWILVMFLSVALLIFLIVGIVFLVKFTSLLSEIEIMVQTGQSIILRISRQLVHLLKGSSQNISAESYSTY